MSVTDQIAKLQADATAAAAKISSQGKALTDANTQIADLKAQLAAAQSGQDGVLQEIANGLDAIDKTLTDALAAP